MREQNLLAALDYEQRVLSCYQTFKGRFVENAIVFDALIFAEQNQIQALSFWLQQRGVSERANNFEIPPMGSYMEALEALLSQEMSKIAFYNQLLATEGNPEVRDIFYRIQATSYNQHLPYIRQNLSYVYANENGSLDKNNKSILEEIERGKQILSQAEGLMNDFKDGNLDEAKLQGFLGSLNYSLIGGVVLGGIAAMILNEILNKNKE